MTQQAPEQQGVHWPLAEGSVCASCGGPVSVEAHQVVPLLISRLGGRRYNDMMTLFQGVAPTEMCAGCFIKLLGTLNNMHKAAVAHGQPSGGD